jgi:serine/threonine protein kinase
LLFNKFDIDRDGYWSKSEFRQFKQSLRSLMQTGPIVIRVVIAIVVVLFTLLLSGFCYLRSFFAAPTKAVAAALVADAPSSTSSPMASAFEDSEAEELRSLRQAAIIAPETLVLSRDSLGQGIGGTVLVGRWQDTTNVACKTLRANCSQREINDFLSEIKLILTLPMHPNIVQVFGVSHKQDSIVLVMEFLPLGNLLDSLRAKASLHSNDEDAFSFSQLLQFAADICKGMVHLSSHSIVHRDLAARNILLGAQESRFVAKVSDFGLSRTLDYLDISAHPDEPTPSAHQRHLAQSVKNVEPASVVKSAPAPAAAAAAASCASDWCRRSSLPTPKPDPSGGYSDVEDVDEKAPPSPRPAPAKRGMQRSESGLPSPLLRRMPTNENKPLPIKWMAPETIFAKQFSPASDVWAFGIVLFEIFSRGEEPYCAFTALEVLNRHRRNQGIVMDCPPQCPPDIYALMLECWQHRPTDRPTFPQLHKRVDDLLASYDDNFFDSLDPTASSSKLWAAARRRHNNRMSTSPRPERRSRQNSTSDGFSLSLPDARLRRNSFSGGPVSAPSNTSDSSDRAPPLKTRSRSFSALSRPSSRERLNVVGYVDAFDPTPVASVVNTDDERSSVGGTTSTTDDSYVMPSSATTKSVPYLLDDDDDNDDNDSSYIEPDASPDISIRSSSRSIPRIVLTASMSD